MSPITWLKIYNHYLKGRSVYKTVVGYYLCWVWGLISSLNPKMNQLEFVFDFFGSGLNIIRIRVFEGGYGLELCALFCQLGQKTTWLIHLAIEFFFCSSLTSYVA